MNSLDNYLASLTDEQRIENIKELLKGVYDNRPAERDIIWLLGKLKAATSFSSALKTVQQEMGCCDCGQMFQRTTRMMCPDCVKSLVDATHHNLITQRQRAETAERERDEAREWMRVAARELDALQANYCNALGIEQSINGLADYPQPEDAKCIVCDAPVLDYKPKYCCSGHERGCMGLPVEPPVCSAKCWDIL